MHIYFSGQILKKGSSPFSILRYVPPPGPSFPLIYVVSIYHMSLQYKGFAGSRGGGTYFNIKMVMTQFFYFLTGNKFALKHVSLIHMCNKTKTKAGLFQQYILCLVL